MNAATEDRVLVRREGAIAVMTLNFPKRMNAFGLAMRQQMWDRLVELEAGRVEEVHVRRLDGHVIEPEAPRQAGVRIRVVERNRALVGEEDVQPRPVHRRARQAGEEGFGHGSAGDGTGEAAARRHGVPGRPLEDRGEALG